MQPNLVEIENLARKIHNVSIVANEYCRQNEDEDIEKISPLIEVVYKESDKLLCKLCGYCDD